MGACAKGLAVERPPTDGKRDWGVVGRGAEEATLEGVLGIRTTSHEAQ